MDRFRSMQTFVRIVDGGSLSAAARALGLSLPAVVRTLSRLEQHLGTRLLNRTTRRISLTDAGRQYYARSVHLLAELEDTELSVSSARQKPEGTLSITAPVLFGRLNVMPLIADYRKRYPNVAVRLLLVDRIVNLIEEGLDLAIRIGHLADSSLVATPLGSVRQVVYASPAYLKRHGVPKHPRDLVEHKCLSFSALTPTDGWSFLEKGKEIQVKVRSDFASNSGDAVISMAEKGAGIGAALCYQIRRQVKQRRLRIVLDDFEPEPLPVSAVYPHGRLTAAKVRAFISMASGALELDGHRGAAHQGGPATPRAI